MSFISTFQSCLRIRCCRKKRDQDGQENEEKIYIPERGGSDSFALGRHDRHSSLLGDTFIGDDLDAFGKGADLCTNFGKEALTSLEMKREEKEVKEEQQKKFTELLYPAYC